MQDDLILEFIKAVRDMDSSFTEMMANQLESQMRQRYGGEEIYIPKKKIQVTQKERAKQEYLEGKPIEETTKKNGISRASLYRHLKK